MMNIKQSPMLARLEIGFRTTAARLCELEKEMITALPDVRRFGAEHGSPDDWNPEWHRQWDDVEAILRRTRLLVIEMHDAIESTEDGRNEKAFAGWDAIQTEDGRLIKALEAIRLQASELPVAVRRDWNPLAQTFETYVEAIFACAQALRVKLDLLEKHSKEDVEQIVQRVLAKLPNPAGKAAAGSRQEYDRAEIELEREQHEYLGMSDLFKSFWQWFESLDERVARNRSLQLEENEERRGLGIAD